MSEKKQPKFFCRKTQRECIMCMVAVMKEPWKCKNLIIHNDNEKSGHENVLTIDLHISFPMIDGETKEEAETRLMDHLELSVPGYVAICDQCEVKEGDVNG